MFGSFLPELWLVGTIKVYSGMGADIVMESLHSSSDSEGLRKREAKSTIRITLPTKLTIEPFVENR